MGYQSLSSAFLGLRISAWPQPDENSCISNAAGLQLQIGGWQAAGATGQDRPLEVVEAAHRGVASMKSGTLRIIAKAPVDRGGVHKCDGFEFNARSPLLRKIKAKGDAEGDVVSKNHGRPAFSG